MQLGKAGAQVPVGGQSHLNGSSAMEGGAGVAKTADSVTLFAAVEGGATLPPPALNCARKAGWIGILGSRTSKG
jgi:hypothetical protein